MTPPAIEPQSSSPNTQPDDCYDFAVIGAGPGGLTAAACLIDNGASTVAWIDPDFSAGRIGAKYPEVPSNTKVQLFLDYVAASHTLSKLVDVADQPNAYTILEGLRRDQGACLSYAAELVRFLTKELITRRPERIGAFQGSAVGVERANGNPWRIKVKTDGSDEAQLIHAHRIVLATGSEPVRPADPILPEIGLDTALSPTKLQNALQEAEVQTSQVAVIGSSHSAILVLKNLTDISTDLSVVHFYRSELRFAEHKDGWILYDNTGLKGLAADWAREVYPHLKQIDKVKLSGDPSEEQSIYQQKLQHCSRAVYAIGFRPVAVPKVIVDGTEKRLTFDNLTGQFDVDGMFGCGIAFPERVVDPVGNVELSVGIWKFMRFLKRVCPVWVGRNNN